ncbi:hypothetical protein [Corynebacterium nasicanis]|uniref:Uncharacterized protein n=1 Tax=Corynebacterium nasicanis TaxID=1448267 RepID=A0ABW1Q9L2_9CORY
MQPSPRPAQRLRSVLATISVGCGVLFFLVSLTMGTWRDPIVGFFFAVGFGLPGAWWFWKEKVDRDNAARYAEAVRQHSYFEGLLGSTDPGIVAGMGEPTPPQPSPRRWGMIIIACLAAFIMATWFIPPVEVTP